MPSVATISKRVGIALMVWFLFLLVLGFAGNQFSAALMGEPMLSETQINSWGIGCAMLAGFFATVAFFSAIVEGDD